MSYTLSTTNWLAPILLPAAAASSSSRSVSEGPRPLPPPRTLRGARAGHYAHSPARGSRRGSIGKPDRSRAPPRPSAPTGPNRWLATWLARSGSGTSPGRQTRGERRGVSGGRAPGAPGAEPARRGGRARLRSGSLRPHLARDPKWRGLRPVRPAGAGPGGTTAPGMHRARPRSPPGAQRRSLDCSRLRRGALPTPDYSSRHVVRGPVPTAQGFPGDDTSQRAALGHCARSFAVSPWLAVRFFCLRPLFTDVDSVSVALSSMMPTKCGKRPY